MFWRRGWNNPHNATKLKSSIQARAQQTKVDRKKSPLQYFVEAQGLHQVGIFALAKIFHDGSKGRVRVAQKGKYLSTRTLPLPQKFITDDVNERHSPTSRGLLAANWRQTRAIVAASTLATDSKELYEAPWMRRGAKDRSYNTHGVATSMYTQGNLSSSFGVDPIDQAAMRIRGDVIGTHLPLTNGVLCGPDRAPYPSVRTLTYFGLAFNTSGAGRGSLLPDTDDEWEALAQLDPRWGIVGCASQKDKGKHLHPASGLSVASAALCGGYGPAVVSWLASGDIEPRGANGAASPRPGPKVVATLVFPGTTGGSICHGPERLLHGGYFVDFGQRWRRFVKQEDDTGPHGGYYSFPEVTAASGVSFEYHLPPLTEKASTEVNMSSTPSTAIARTHQFLATLSPSILLGLSTASLRYLIETVAAVGCPNMDGSDAALILAVTEQWHEFATSPLQQLELLRCMAIVAGTYASQVAGRTGAARVVTGDTVARSFAANPSETLRATTTRFLVFSSEMFAAKLWQTLPSLLKFFGSRGLVLEVLELLDLAFLWVGDSLPTTYNALLETVGRQSAVDGGAERPQPLASFFPNGISVACEATAPFAFFRESCGLGASVRSASSLVAGLRGSGSAVIEGERRALIEAAQAGGWWDTMMVSLACFEARHDSNGLVGDVPLLRGGGFLLRAAAEVTSGMWRVPRREPSSSSKVAPIPLARRVASLEWTTTHLAFVAKIVKCGLPSPSSQTSVSNDLPLFGVFSDLLAEVSLIAEALGVASKLILTSSIGTTAPAVVLSDLSRASSSFPSQRVDTSLAISQQSSVPSRLVAPQDAVSISLTTNTPLPRLKRAHSSHVPVTSLTPVSAVIAPYVNPFRRSPEDLQQHLIRSLYEEAIPMLVHVAALCTEGLIPRWRAGMPLADCDAEMLQDCIEGLHAVQELWTTTVGRGLKVHPQALLICPDDFDVVCGGLAFLHSCVGDELVIKQ